MVAYESENIYCHGVRDLDTLNEEDPDEYCQKYGWAMPKWERATSLNEVIEKAKRLNPVKSEVRY